MSIHTEARADRRKQTAEDFTPLWLVNQMLDKLPSEVWKEGKTFCDPACGNGNFLVEVLKRKLKLGHGQETVLSTIYGVDISGINIRECRLRLLALISETTRMSITRQQMKSVWNNIVVLSLDRKEKGSNVLKYPDGALSYEFDFEDHAGAKDIDRWLKGVNEDGWLENVDIDKGIVEPIKELGLVGKLVRPSLFGERIVYEPQDDWEEEIVIDNKGNFSISKDENEMAKEADEWSMNQEFGEKDER